MAVQRPVAERWQKMTGSSPEGYMVFRDRPSCASMDATKFSGISACRCPSTDVAIRDDDETTSLSVVGEISACGPQVMTGYWNRQLK